MFDQQAFDASLGTLREAYARGDVAAATRIHDSLRAALEIADRDLASARNMGTASRDFLVAADALQGALHTYGEHVSLLVDPSDPAVATARRTIARQHVLAGEIEHRLATPDDAWTPPAIDETRRSVRRDIALALAALVVWLEADPGREVGSRQELDPETTLTHYHPSLLVMQLRRRPGEGTPHAEGVHVRFIARRDKDDPLRFTATEVRAIRGHWPPRHSAGRDATKG